MKHPTYEDLIPEFGEEKLKKRYSFLQQACSEFIREFGAEDYLRVSHRLLSEVVVSHFADIQRLKQFHGIRRTSNEKVAAYTGYWLSRLKPLQLYAAPPKDRRDIPEFNQWLAMNVMLAMAFDISEMHSMQPGRYVKFFNRLRYHLTYRQINPQALELVLVAIELESPYTALGGDQSEPYKD